MNIISITVGKNPLEEMEQTFHSQKKSLKFSPWVESQKQQNDLGSFPGQTTVIQVYAPTTNAKEAQQLYEDQ